MVLDLEDAVAISDKDAARAAVEEFLTADVPVVVRINGVDTGWCADDLRLLRGRRCAVMVPKAHSAEQLQRVAAALSPGTPLIALIETAAGVQACAAVCSVETVVRAAFGSIDLATELGVDASSFDALRYARSAVVIGSAVAGLVAPLDGVTTDVRDDSVLAADVAHAVDLGFGGKLCIHPCQAEFVNTQFSPSAELLEWARRVVDSASAAGVCVVDGKMVDKPVIDRAKRILSRTS